MNHKFISELTIIFFHATIFFKQANYPTSTQPQGTPNV